MKCHCYADVTFRTFLCIGIVCLIARRCNAKGLIDGNENIESDDCDMLFFTNTTMTGNHHEDLAATMATLRSYMDTMKEIRRRRRGTGAPSTGGDLLLQKSLLISAANLHLLAPPAETSQGDLGSEAEALSSGRTLGHQCGGSSALGIFNFLTFVVYAFSLLTTLVSLATGSMADTLSGTFLSNLLRLLGRRGRRRRRIMKRSSLRQQQMLGLRFKRASLPPLRSTRQPLQKEEEEDLDQILGSGLMTALLSLSGGSPPSLTCPPPLSSVTHSLFLQEAMARLSISS